MAHVDRERLAYFLSKLKLWVQDNSASRSVATPYSAGLMSPADKAKLDGVATDADLNASSMNPVRNSAVTQALQDLGGRVSSLENAGSQAYTYKGSVQTKSDLPASGNQVGDVYDVLTAPDAGSWAWDGFDWSRLSGFVDLSALATKDVATPASDGLMSASDKSALDRLMSGFVPVWSSGTVYDSGMVVRGSDGKLYYSQTSSGPGTAAGAKNPVDGYASYWSEVMPASAVLQSLAGARAGAIASGGSFPVPSYVVGSGRLKVFLDGVLCALGESYSESGADGQYSTSITFLQTIPTSMDIVVRVG